VAFKLRNPSRNGSWIYSGFSSLFYLMEGICHPLELEQLVRSSIMSRECFEGLTRLGTTEETGLSQVKNLSTRDTFGASVKLEMRYDC
jgi:hypothetical protein